MLRNLSWLWVLCLGCPGGGLVKGDVQATRVLLVTCHLQVLQKSCTFIVEIVTKCIHSGSTFFILNGSVGMLPFQLRKVKIYANLQQKTCSYMMIKKYKI
jgi:hypothetical protein